MTFQKRLQRLMKRREWRVADLARKLDEPYTTVREWVENGRLPTRISEIGESVEKLEFWT